VKVRELNQAQRQNHTLSGVWFRVVHQTVGCSNGAS
jgi:hypothetical protein